MNRTMIVVVEVIIVLIIIAVLVIPSIVDYYADHSKPITVHSDVTTHSDVAMQQNKSFRKNEPQQVSSSNRKTSQQEKVLHEKLVLVATRELGTLKAKVCFDGTTFIVENWSSFDWVTPMLIVNFIYIPNRAGWDPTAFSGYGLWTRNPCPSSRAGEFPFHLFKSQYGVVWNPELDPLRSFCIHAWDLSGRGYEWYGVFKTGWQPLLNAED